MLDHIMKVLPEFCKPARAWIVKQWRGMKFDNPLGGFIADKDEIELTGRYFGRDTQDHYVYTKKSEIVYPQHDLIFVESEKRWTVKCHVNHSNPEPSTVYLAECSPEIRCLFDYYFIAGKKNEEQNKGESNKNNWIGIPIKKHLEGLKIIDSTVVRKKH